MIQRQQVAENGNQQTLNVIFGGSKNVFVFFPLLHMFEKAGLQSRNLGQPPCQLFVHVNIQSANDRAASIQLLLCCYVFRETADLLGSSHKCRFSYIEKRKQSPLVEDISSAFPGNNSSSGFGVSSANLSTYRNISINVVSAEEVVQ